MPPEQQARLLSRLDASVVAAMGMAGAHAAPAGHALASAKGVFAGKLATGAVIFAMGGLSGAGLHAWLRRPPPKEAPAVQPGLVQSTVPPPPALQAEPLPRAPAVLPAPKAHRNPAPPPQPAPSTQPPAEGASRLDAERSLLEPARSALARGNREAARVALDKHREQFPEGALCEEREALWVQLLVTEQKYGEARARAADFRRKYPKSLLAPAVEAAVGSIP